jgi:hypothetical protein
VCGITVTGPTPATNACKDGANTAADITRVVYNVIFTAANKIYNGNTGATVTACDDRVAGDLLTVELHSATFADKKVGTAKPVT